MVLIIFLFSKKVEKQNAIYQIFHTFSVSFKSSDESMISIVPKPGIVP